MLSKPGQGYLNSGLTSEKAKSAIEELTGKKRPPMSGDAIVFSRGVRRTFEAATNASFSASICICVHLYLYLHTEFPT